MSDMATGCGHCGFKGELDTKGQVTAEESTEDADGYAELTISKIWTLARCPNCERPTLESYIWVEPLYMEPEDATLERVYPTPLDNGSLPPGVQKQVDASHRVKVIEPSFYAVGIRRMLEAVCRDQGATGRTLEKQIAALVADGKLPDVFAGMAGQLRKLGNWGAHDGDTDVLPEDVPLIEEFADAILDYLYRAPAKLQAVEDALERRLNKAREGWTPSQTAQGTA